MQLNDASRIIDVIDQRIEKRTASESRVETTWGTVAAVDASGRYADLYLYGEVAPYASEYFRLPLGMTVNVGDSVKAAIDRERGDRWVQEVHTFDTHNRLAFDYKDGHLLLGGGAAAPDLRLYRSGTKTLTIDDGAGGAATVNVIGTLQQNGNALLDSSHTAAADPHTGYQQESERGQANGYVGYDANRGVWTGIGASTPDGAALLTIDSQRAWAFEQVGTGASTALRLRDMTGAKQFQIAESDGTARLRVDMNNDRVGINGQLAFEDGAGTFDVRLRRTQAGRMVYDQNSAAVAAEFGIAGTSAAQRAKFDVRVSGDGSERAALWGDATMQGLSFGPGNTAPDTNLYRAGTDHLKTDDMFSAPLVGVATTASGVASTIAAAGTAVLAWGTRGFDTGTGYNTTNKDWTVPAGKGGYYLIMATINNVNQTNAVNAHVRGFLNINGVAQGPGCTVTSLGGTNVKNGMSGVYSLAAGDKVSISAGALTNSADVTLHHVAIIRLFGDSGMA